MPSYPGSIFAPASRSNGQTIDASHVNDLQDEVVAVETGLLNGTARLNSSNSTAANLSVTGGSTLNNLQVSTGSTFAGPVTFSSAVTINGAVTFGTSGTLTVPRPNNCRVTSSAAIEIPGVSAVGLNFDVERFDQGGLHDTATNSSRITFGSTGLWEIGANVEWNASLQGGPSLKILLNDTTVLAEAYGPLVASKKQAQTVTTLHLVTTTTDFVTVTVAQDSGSTASLAKTDGSSPEFWAYRVSN